MKTPITACRFGKLAIVSYMSLPLSFGTTNPPRRRETKQPSRQWQSISRNSGKNGTPSFLSICPIRPANIQRARISASSDSLNILYIEDQVPHRHLGSGFPRSNEILCHLVKQGHRVTCASFTSRLLENEYGDIPRDVELLDGISQRERLFREYVPNSDIVWVSRPHNMEAFLKERVGNDSSRQGAGNLRC